jgi:hypothetical protein
MILTSRISVYGHPWEVPKGFGREYKRHAMMELATLAEGTFQDSIEELQKLLGLIGYIATAETICDWTLRRRVEVSVYASNVHLRASDNTYLRKHPPLKWLPNEGPWAGKIYTDFDGSIKTGLTEIKP